MIGIERESFGTHETKENRKEKLKPKRREAETQKQREMKNRGQNTRRHNRM